MKTLRIKTAVQVNKTAGAEGEPPVNERITLTPLAEAEENQKIFKGLAHGSVYTPITLPVDNADSFGVFDGVTEAYIEITPVAPARQKKAKKSAKAARASKPEVMQAPARKTKMKVGKKSTRRFVSAK